MLDIKWIRQHPDTVQEAADAKGIDVSIRELLEWDGKRRSLISETEGLRESRNKLSQRIAQLSREANAREAENKKSEAKLINESLRSAETALADAERHYNELMMLVPNVVSPDTPAGRSDADNVELRLVGEPRITESWMKDHVALGELHRMIDVPRGVKAAGTRNYYLTADGALLHRAVQQLAIDLVLAQGFTLLEVPLMVRPDALYNTGFFPLGEDQVYRIEEENKHLIGTSEVPLVTYHANEIVDASEPIKLAAASVCFRSEVGSTGKDVQGLYRVHQFAKVEQVVLCEADPALSDSLLNEITANAEKLLRLLELPYRVVAVCTGDMSQKTYKQYDIETWMPCRGSYGETHSSSNLHDFQARRSNIRYRDADGNLRYCHTLNNTAVASPRILIPLLENHQAEDGSIHLPAALRPYMGGRDRLYPIRLD
ncbi:serine--tRNA ligase [Cohnella cholangitidis]|uniref:Serine--tRNA ligase n=1 Tax=Cohnella cholangitidis TaxID=2598458 RepID=A0A7G5BUF3_9BACL|nr:serine--tRNA ligase [Cohnella cholangitidis]QMV40587.1 serine--tRNA ligase [Cohnella cholangitidis]